MTKISDIVEIIGPTEHLHEIIWISTDTCDFFNLNGYKPCVSYTIKRYDLGSYINKIGMVLQTNIYWKCANREYTGHLLLIGDHRMLIPIACTKVISKPIF